MSGFYSEMQIILQTARAWHVRGFVDAPSQTTTTVPAGNGESSPIPMAVQPVAAASTTIEGLGTQLSQILGLERSVAIERINGLVQGCTSCDLCKGRTKAVPGTGALSPKIMVIGEGPGADEDRMGLPFVGAAGQYLDKWLEAINLSRYQNCYIANVVKCRPPQNRDPQPAEIAACTPYLRAQISVLKPKAILVVGRVAAGYLLGRPVKMHEVRGKFFTYEAIPFMATFHPAAVLRDQSLKKDVWDDLKSFRSKFLD